MSVRSKFLLARNAGIPRLTAVKCRYILGKRSFSPFALVPCSWLEQTRSYKALYPTRSSVAHGADAQCHSSACTLALPKRFFFNVGYILNECLTYSLLLVPTSSLPITGDKAQSIYRRWQNGKNCWVSNVKWSSSVLMDGEKTETVAP